MSSSSVDGICLFNEFINSFVHFRFSSVVQVKTTFNTEVITSHNSWLSIGALTYDEGQLRVFYLDVFVVVQDERPI